MRFRLAVIALIAATLPLGAQDQKPLPRWEVQLELGSGWQSLLYKLPDNPVWSAGFNTTDANCPMSPQYGGSSDLFHILAHGGLGVTYHINKNWGIVTGAEYAAYQGDVSLGFLYSAEYAEYNGNKGVITNRLKNFSERQTIMYVSVPILAQFTLPVFNGNCFYAQAGMKFGIPVYSIYTQTADETAYDYGQNLKPYVTDAGFTYFNFDTGFYAPEAYIRQCKENDTPINVKNHPSVSKDAALPVGLDVMLSMEVGMRWRIAKWFGIYTGFFFDYGLNNPVKASGTAIYVNNRSWESDDPVTGGVQPYRIEGADRTVSFLEASNPAYFGGRSYTENGKDCFEIDEAPTVESGRLVNTHTMALGFNVRFSFGFGSVK